MKSFVVILLLAAFANALPSKFPRLPLDGKIVGGQPVDIRSYPHQVSVQVFGFHYCGGSIIAPNRILTAAHCTEGKPPTYFFVRAGSSFYFEGGQLASVSEIWEHPDYDSTTFDNDVAVLTLATNLTMNSSVKIIKVTSVEPTGGQIANVSGWGHTVESGQTSEVLRAVSVPIVDRTTCNSKNYYNGQITDQMICAGIEKGGKDSCQEDSGGPLIINGVQYGIVSWGNGCARPKRPGVYTNLAVFKSDLETFVH